MELFTLLPRVAPPVTRDNAVISQIDEASEVVHDIRLRTCTRISAAARAFSGVPNANKKLMDKVEVGKSSPLRLAQPLERA